MVDYRIVDTGVRPLDRALELIGDSGRSPIIATGYGRRLLQERIGCEAVTEIKAYARGAAHYNRNCRTVIDISGQDSKVIQVKDGKVVNFHMNDRCAAGTGRFLEIMASTLGYDIREFSNQALKAGGAVSINSMCTVFAESEVISLIAKGEPPPSIALGLHESIVSRLIAMMGSIEPEPEIIFAGGVALNECVRKLIERQLGMTLVVPPEPQIVGALGAALLAQALG